MLPAWGCPSRSLLARQAQVQLQNSSSALPGCHLPPAPSTLKTWPNYPTILTSLLSPLPTYCLLGFCRALLFFMLLSLWATDNMISTLLLLAVILSFLPFNRISHSFSSAMWARLYSRAKIELDHRALGVPATILPSPLPKMICMA